MTNLQRFLVTVTVAGAALGARAQVIYVDADATGANDGTSWADAYTQLQNGLTRARQSGQPKEVWVAVGTYHPDEGSSVTAGDRAVSFLLNADGLSLYGGFDGSETARSQRDPVANPTILSGDLSGNDGPSFANRGDNSWHVVTMSLSSSIQTARLDGFTVGSGNAGSSFPNNSGAGIYIPIGNSGRVNIIGCRITDNRATSAGGGVYSDSNGQKNIISCTFEGNAAGSGGGGGFGGRATNLTAANCLFLSNLGGSNGGIGNGGGMAVNSPGGLIVNSTFSQNTLQSTVARGGAGLALTSSDATPTVSNCIFWQNIDGQGFMDERAQIDRVSTSAALPTVQYSLVQGLSTTFAGADNNIDPSDPMIDVDYTLLPGSPAINAGDQSLLPLDSGDVDDDGNTSETLPLDLAGGPRVLCSSVDMGAYESAAGGGGLAITCPPDVTLECPADTSPATTGDPNTTGCGTITVTYDDSVTPGCGDTETIERTWTADDGADSVTCVQTITVVDTTAPELTIPADITLDCAVGTDPSQAGEATATDTCDAAPAVTYSDATMPGACPESLVVTRTWTATDACGNSASADQVITVEDTTPPVLTIPADATLDCDADADPNSVGVATATDDCDSSPTVTYLDTTVPGTCPYTQVISRTWTATDACGNATSATQMVNLVDTTPPTIECPADIEVDLENGECAATLSLGSPAAADACSDVTVTNDAPAAFPAGTTIVTWTATDTCGNATTCEQQVTVNDLTAPFLHCSVDRHLLWPPNHTLVNVGLSVDIEVDCDSGIPPTVEVYSNEDDEEDTGSGIDSPDAKDIAESTLRLRAERKGDGDGRVYLIVVSAEDLSGNVGETTCVVVVPQSRRPLATLQVVAEGAFAKLWFALFDAPPPYYVPVGDGPVIGPNQ